MALQTAATLSALGFGSLCISSAFPLLGLPFPSKQAVGYYRRKSAWLAELSGHTISITTAGCLAAVLRLVVGACVILPGTREAALLANGGVVAVGTALTIRDRRPLAPQFGMLIPMALVFWLNRLASA